MKPLLAQQVTPVQPQPNAPTLAPWAEGTVILAAIAYLVTNVIPNMLNSWTKRSELAAHQDIQNEAVMFSTVLTTLTKMQDALLAQQNTMVANLLNRHQIATEDVELVKVITSQNEIFKTLIGNQEKILECLQQLSLNKERESIEN